MYSAFPVLVNKTPALIPYELAFKWMTFISLPGFPLTSKSVLLFDQYFVMPSFSEPTCCCLFPVNIDIVHLTNMFDRFYSISV